MAWTRRTVNSRILCPGLPLPLTLWPMAEKASQRVLLPPSLAEKSRPLWKAAFEEPFPPRAQTYSESVLPGRLQQLDHFHRGAQLCDGGQCVRDVLTVLVAIAIELGETQGRSLGHRVEAGRDRERSNHQMPHPPPSVFALAQVSGEWCFLGSLASVPRATASSGLAAHQSLTSCYSGRWAGLATMLQGSVLNTLCA